ncbi:MAG: ribonuclease E/G [Alphaproteobacteria bacterium]|nr:ribonuclease E/G [Alphaproteobacteria bacterium]
MTTRLLIDAAHPEETRVVVIKGNRLEDFDYESSTKTQLRGNIYLAKVTRVEPSLQAAFVEYGGNRHGFLAFSEIHPDYYQIPVADREKLIAEEEAAAEIDSEQDNTHPPTLATEARAESGQTQDPPGIDDASPGVLRSKPTPTVSLPSETPSNGEATLYVAGTSSESNDDFESSAQQFTSTSDNGNSSSEPVSSSEAGVPSRHGGQSPASSEGSNQDSSITDAGSSDDVDESVRRRRRMRLLRSYRIQEVIKRRQILLVQVVKDERGSKGAALTTYLSLAGRYCVLMPNTARGGGVSRKIVDQADRRRLKSVINELEVPKGMGLIVRTAGSERSRAEIKRDYEYLLRVWENVRDLTLKSTAPCLVYEEANLIKRAMRDLYSKDMDEIMVEGEEAHKNAKNFMRMLMPSHAKRVKLYKDRMPLFQRFQVEEQFDAMHSPQVRLKGGGYLVINSTEALVAIDVNSGRSTKERNIEETALHTNLEAADEVARHLRLRDLGGLVVIDFIDMDDSRNNRTVERRLKDALKADRARIQVGRISGFGLLEMSRQRLRPSLLEASSIQCEHCGGSGYRRSTESTALHVLRVIENECVKKAGGELTVFVSTPVAIYALNHKRAAVERIEALYGVRIFMAGDDTLIPPNSRIERVAGTIPLPVVAAATAEMVMAAAEPSEEDAADDQAAAEDDDLRDRAPEPQRPRDEHRHRRHRDRDRKPAPDQHAQVPVEAQDRPLENQTPQNQGSPPEGEGEIRKRRRRGKRGGRRRRRGGDRGEGASQQQPGQNQPDVMQPAEVPLSEHSVAHNEQAPPHVAPPLASLSASASVQEYQPEPTRSWTPPEPRSEPAYTPPPPPRPSGFVPAELAPRPAASEDRTPPPDAPPPFTRKGWWRRAFE